MSEKLNEVDALSAILGVLSPLDVEERRRIIDTVLTFFSHERRPKASRDTVEASIPLFEIDPEPGSGPIPFSTRLDITPKDFLLQKRPKTDVERIACLAFYLTHYRATPHFKTVDLSTLNTEAAQPKFANAAYAVNNATKYGYLAPATKGTKQISAQGEQFVVALPDRAAAKAAMVRRRQRAKRSSRPASPRKSRREV